MRPTLPSHLDFSTVSTRLQIKRGDPGVRRRLGVLFGGPKTTEKREKRCGGGGGGGGGENCINSYYISDLTLCGPPF